MDLPTNPAEQATVEALAPIMMGLFKTLGSTTMRITPATIEAISGHLVNAYKAGQAAAWDEGYADGQQDAERASLIAAGLREAHTNPHHKEQK